MPTYKNNTNRRITFAHKGTLEWWPEQEHRLHYFVPHFDLGIDMIDPEPYVTRYKSRNFWYHEAVITPAMPLEDRTFWMPYWETIQVSAYIIQSFEGRGELEMSSDTNCDTLRMYVGDTEMPVVVDLCNNHLGHYAWDLSAYLTFESDNPVAVGIKVEPYTYRGTETISGR